MYDIQDLRGKLLVELREMAKSMGMKKVDSLKKEDLIFRLLDEQASRGFQSQKPVDRVAVPAAGGKRERVAKEGGVAKSNVPLLTEQLMVSPQEVKHSAKHAASQLLSSTSSVSLAQDRGSASKSSPGGKPDEAKGGGSASKEKERLAQQINQLQASGKQGKDGRDVKEGKGSAKAKDGRADGQSRRQGQKSSGEKHAASPQGNSRDGKQNSGNTNQQGSQQHGASRDEGQQVDKQQGGAAPEGE